MTHQREAELSKSLHHEGQATGKLWLLPLWVAPPCDLFAVVTTALKVLSEIKAGSQLMTPDAT